MPGKEQPKQGRYLWTGKGAVIPEFDSKQDSHCSHCLGLSTEEEYPLSIQGVKEGGLR